MNTIAASAVNFSAGRMNASSQGVLSGRFPVQGKATATASRAKAAAPGGPAFGVSVSYPVIETGKLSPPGATPKLCFHLAGIAAPFEV